LLVLALHFYLQSVPVKFWVLATCMLPVTVYFFIWADRVWKNTAAADFKHTMRMNILASCCTSLGFLVLLTLKYLE
jgi:1,4-dihydroxy-2-naphthoate octaprenyltransferase